MSTNNPITLLGNGSMATALAKILTDNGRRVHWWFRNEERARYMAQRRHNAHYLTSVAFPEGSVAPTTNLEEACAASDTIVFVVPAAYAQPMLEALPTAALLEKRFVSAVKGVLPDARRLPCDFLESRGMPMKHFVAITGPCHAEEVAAERLSYLTFSGLDADTTGQAAASFRTPYLRTTWNGDLWGAQYAAVLKNIYAIGAGMAHGLDYGDNFLSVFITACYREMHAFLVAHFEQVHPMAGGRPDFHTSAYLGDLLVTCYSLHSRNRTFGAMIGKGYSVQAATLEMSMVAEGHQASRGMRHIAQGLGLSLPIADMVYRILWEGENAREAFETLEGSLS